MIKSANLSLRFILELCALISLTYWGVQVSDNLIVKIVLGVGAPLTAAIVWGLVVSPKAKVNAPAQVRLLIELLVWAAAIAGLVTTPRTTFALVFGVLIVIHLVLAYGFGQK